MKQFPIKYTILKNGTRENVEGFYLEQFPGLAIRRDEKLFHVEHVPSGYFVWAYGKKADALSFVKDVGSLLEWEVDLDTLKQTFLENMEHLRYVNYRLCGFAYSRPEPLERKARGQAMLF